MEGKKPMICTLPKSKPLIFNYRLTDMIFQITPEKNHKEKNKVKNTEVHLNNYR
jgi:hypothetical protein